MIKFRAWDKIQNKMLLPDNIEFINGQAYWAEASIGDNGSYSNDGEADGIGALFELEQFTGLKDVNGNEIYEGNIIKSNYKYAQPKVSQIIIENGNSYILGEDLATGNEMLVSDHISEIKVIGNVHENAELLEEDK
ncbi:YopX family protein [Lactiplantibacillus plantarum]|uniref:YopX family protein n=1 Tax=Lactiplantibacillus plantarum TaxID=1590 RepID=UPI001E614CD5|nr:YopX family protein [Lactiplantibacillus plantarum]MDF3264344.1 YopX family protein [Lactiplantibacillus plantarum]MDO1602821.1 YopX family protein [Lactiplantibacillus plantarum]MEE4614889.1 YopX family protein [Lactiplantibacillus plantarum]